MAQTLLEEDESADTPVAVLEGMDALKTDVKVQKIPERPGRQAIRHPFIPGKQFRHLFCHALGRRSLPSTHLVCEKLVGAYLEPALAAVACALFQHGVQKQYVLLGEGTLGIVYYPVDTAKVVGSLDYVVHPENRTAFIASHGIGLVHEGRLLMREATPFHMVGMIGEVHLYLMVDAA